MNDRDIRKGRVSVALATVKGLDKIDMLFMINLCEARQIFISKVKTLLTVTQAMPCKCFNFICQKFDTRRIYETNGF